MADRAAVSGWHWVRVPQVEGVGVFDLRAWWWWRHLVTTGLPLLLLPPPPPPPPLLLLLLLLRLLLRGRAHHSLHLKVLAEPTFP